MGLRDIMIYNVHNQIYTIDNPKFGAYTRWCPTSYVCWCVYIYIYYIKPSMDSMDTSTINTSYVSELNQVS